MEVTKQPRVFLKADIVLRASIHLKQVFPIEMELVFRARPDQMLRALTHINHRYHRSRFRLRGLLLAVMGQVAAGKCELLQGTLDSMFEGFKGMIEVRLGVTKADKLMRSLCAR